MRFKDLVEDEGSRGRPLLRRGLVLREEEGEPTGGGAQVPQKLWNQTLIQNIFHCLHHTAFRSLKYVVRKYKVLHNIQGGTQVEIRLGSRHQGGLGLRPFVSDVAVVDPVDEITNCQFCQIISYF